MAISKEVWISDVWQDKATNKHWRVIRGQRIEGDVVIAPCAKLTGLLLNGGKEVTVTRERFIADYEYRAHANL